MPLNPNPVGPEIADYFVDNAPTPGTPVGRPELEAIWLGAINLLYDDVKATADVVPVAHSGEDLSAPAGQPVTIPSTSIPGSPSTGATTTDTPVDGKGSIV